MARIYFCKRSDGKMNKLLILIVRGYQKFISPLFPSSCRYHPTCSSYMIDAIKMHGAFKGVIMGIARIFRCNPFVKGGIDYVPPYFSLRRNPNPVYVDPDIYQKNKRKL